MRAANSSRCAACSVAAGAAGENVSNGDRVGLNISYSLGWLRQEENQYKASQRERLAAEG